MRILIPLCAIVIWANAMVVESGAAEPTLRVMTFNIRYATAPDGDNAWDNRKELLLEVIRNFNPDLLGTQEVLATQFDYLAENLVGYAAAGVGRDDGLRKGEFSAIYYKKSRFEPVESGTFWLSETPDQPGSKSWDSSLPRVATWVKLRDRMSGRREICYLNTHWDHRGNQARVESAKIIRRWLSEHAGGDPIVVTGDFNVNEDHEGYRTLVSAEGTPRLHDAYRQVHPEPQPQESTFGGFKGNRRGKRIDFILISPEISAMEAAIDTTSKDGRYPSDHYPVTAVLRLGERPPK